MALPKYPTLSSPSFINQMELKNRMILAPMGSNYADASGKISEKLKNYLEVRAKGGVGMIILETSSVSWPLGASMPNMVGLSKDEFIPDLMDLTKRVHKYDTKIAAQLNQSGKVSQEDISAGRPILVPSIPDKESSDLINILTLDELNAFVKSAGPDGKGPKYKELTLEEINKEINFFVTAAQRVKISGFDAIEIHAGHGYLISSFLSPSINKRKDEYGGSPKKRARLLEEIIKKIRSKVGPSFPIIVRLDAIEFRINNGIIPSDFLITAKIAEEAGADALDVSAYGNSNIGIAFTEGPLVHKPGGFIDFAKLAKEFLNIPIIAVGRIELDVAENNIKEGNFNFLALGRKLLADPELPNKVMMINKEMIRPCIYCYVCVSKIFINKPMNCAVNSSLGNEVDDKNLLQKSINRLKILVVGGGPAGMEVSRLLMHQGHNVSIWEQDKDLGGSARMAGLAYKPNQDFIDYLRNSLEELNVPIKLNKTATIKEIQNNSPDLVIIATGANRSSPEIIGKDLRHVFDGEQLRKLLFSSESTILKKITFFQSALVQIGRLTQLLRNITFLRFISKFWMPFGKNITIIGGDLVGLELAEFLSHRNRNITVLEPSRDLGSNLSIVRRARLIHELKNMGVNLFTNIKIKEITKTKVNYSLNEQNLSTKSDQVIIALGAEPKEYLSEELIKLKIKVCTIGDCHNVGYIEGAIMGARKLVKDLNEVSL